MSDINIVAINPRTRRITFAFQVVPKRTRGIETLLQLAAKTILTTPGIDLFSPEYGGGFLSYSGRNLSIQDMPRIYADVAYIIRKSEEQILSEQAVMPMDTQDRLRSLTLLSIDYLPDEAALDARVLVTSAAGERAEISLANQIRFKRHEYIYDPKSSLYKLHQSLNGIERDIMEYLYAYNGKPLLSVTEIANKFGVTEQYVIEVRNRLSIRLKELQ